MGTRQRLTFNIVMPIAIITVLGMIISGSLLYMGVTQALITSNEEDLLHGLEIMDHSVSNKKQELANTLQYCLDDLAASERTFDSKYNIRENLPQDRGYEAKTNTAPMQRGLLIDETKNNIGVVTKGLTQYEVFKNKLYIPILRATGVISNPQNPARTTPAGPPIETPALQMIGENRAEFYVFFGNQNTLEEVINKVYNFVIT